MKNSLISRAHNKIEKEGNWVIKTSQTNFDKLHSEFEWFEKASFYFDVPNVEEIMHGYKIEFIEGDNLGEVFWNKSLSEQKIILDKYIRHINLSRLGEDLENGIADELLINKFVDRVDVLPDKFKTQLMKEIVFYKDSIPEIVSKISNKNFFSVMHGDVFFGNTIIKGGKLTLIDPRGVDEEWGIKGNVFYDLIKLAHSVHGKYDMVIFGLNDTMDNSEISKYFFDIIFKVFGLTKKQILIGEMGLFISMLPIHSDSEVRQQNLVDISKLIFKELLWKK